MVAFYQEVITKQHKENRMKYCEVQNGVIVKYNVTREMYGIGVNSPESACVSKGLYLLIDTPISYDRATHRQTSVYVIDEPNKQVNKVYTTTAIPQAELDAIAQAELESEARRGLDDTAVLMPTDVNDTLDAETQAHLVTFRNDCIAVLEETHTNKPVAHHKVKSATKKYKK